MAHWRKSYQPTQFHSLAAWALGASIVLATLVLIQLVEGFAASVKNISAQA
jgi:hypothetical protein